MENWNLAAGELGIEVSRLQEIANVLKRLELVEEVDPDVSRAELTRLACYDLLTGLPNSFLFKDRLSYHLAHSKRYNKIFAIMFIDLDNFKAVNDTYSHAAGDAVLKDVATALKSIVRSNDLVARLHGDEFVILLDEMMVDETLINTISTKILNKISSITYNGKSAGISASIGVSYYPNDGTDIETLISRADNAMFKAKKAGKNNYVLCDHTEEILA